MAAYFLDSSGAMKRYVKETGATWVVSIADPAVGNDIYVARITGVEVISAIARRTRGGGLSAADAAIAMAGFRHDFSHQYQIVEISSGLIARAMTLAETHALRGYDAIQLAAALMVKAQCLTLGTPAPTLVSANVDLNAAATAEGLAVDDPNNHP